MQKIYLLAGAICLSLALKAQDSLKATYLDEVVFTGNKTETPVEKSGKTIYKLDRKQIEANRGKDVTDLLNEIPGVQVDGNFATPGTDIGYRIRGAQSEQTLILIDGIPFNDPSALQQTFDLRLLDLDQVESIEVVKGGLSSLYGTGAAAGVINIILKKESEDAISGSINLEEGSFNTSTSNVNVNGSIDRFSYMLSGTYRASDGFSAALDTIGNQGFDDDGIESLNFLGRLGYQFSDQFSLGLTTAYDDISSEFDGGAFSDNDSELDQKQLRFNISPTYKWARGSVSGNFSYHTNKRRFDSTGFIDPSERSISQFNGTSYHADIFFDYNLSDEIKLLGGLNFQLPSREFEGADSERFNIMDRYISLIYDRRNINLQVGGRLNRHSLYGSNFVWNVNPSYTLNLGASKLKLLGSYATAFRAPSLNELYAGDFGFLLADAGNPDLNPQESASTEVGFELNSNNKLQFGAVYFYRKDKDLIDFVFNDSFTEGTYINAEGETKVDGFEINGSYVFAPQLTLSGHYTYTNSLTEDMILRRVPQDKFGFTLSVVPIENLLLKLTHLHVGETPESDDVSLDSFDLFDGFVSYAINQFTLSGGVNNIFDIDYVDRFGWAAADRNFNLGVRYSF